MKSQKLGNDISETEVLNVSPNGIWVLVAEKEYFLPYSDFSWFKEASVSAIYNLKFTHGHHLYWPDLDIDLELESLENLEQYPLKYQS